MSNDTAGRDYWLQDLHTLESIERWGAALFLAGTGLVARQIAVFKGAGPFDAPTWFTLVPLAIGVYGTIFLRVVNRRIRHDKTKLGDVRQRRIGWLGWGFAAMPVAWGLTLTVALL